ncbi:hypothetical protein UUU_10360 [Klebsiella pneumoniae subsp. pneumoniae DSM 30104 = JCM 1662 = NBRC 14940]|nr:hypothetical protein UUU_10360 [Klebsiella pneumoniae subsp. pneumoniae DSM 30104 = JCM 1662 = NBRC 14940]
MRLIFNFVSAGCKPKWRRHDVTRLTWRAIPFRLANQNINDNYS